MNAFAVVAAVLLVTAAGGVGVVAGAPTGASATDARTDVLAADESAVADLTDAIQRLDEFLETLLDLVRTLNQLFGGGGAAGD